MKQMEILCTLLLCSIPSTFATETVVTHLGGNTQIWYLANAYDTINGEVASVPDIINQGLADGFEVVDGSLTGNPMAFYGDSDRHGNEDWWLEYDFDVPTERTWYVWARASQNAPSDNSLGSHYFWVLGDFDDAIPDPGVFPEFLDELDRIFGDRFKDNEGDEAIVGSNAWVWVGSRGTDLGVSDLDDPRYPLPKPFKSGANVVRIYERESGAPSVQFEIFVICDVDYDQWKPSDEDAKTALELETAVIDYFLY